MGDSIIRNINITVSVPPGTSHHGNPNLICTPTKWNDVLLFFATNYFAHAMTVVSSPGQHWTRTLEIIFTALFLPIFGVSRALTPIFDHPVTERDPIKRAARAGALCMVGRKIAKTPDRTEPVPVITRSSAIGMYSSLPQYYYELNRTRPAPMRTQDDVREWWDATNVDYESSTYGTVESSRRVVNGGYKLTDAYCLLFVQPGAPLSAPTLGPGLSQYSLASSFNAPKLLISLIQALWAIVTIYRARGDQIEQFGYAAFGLTVAPYAVMSVINIIGNLLQPEYPSMFIVRTPLMDEAERAGCYFECDVKAHIGSGGSPSKLIENGAGWFHIQGLAGFLLGPVALLGIVGGLSGFRKQQSTGVAQRSIIMWWVLNLTLGPLCRLFQAMPSNEEISSGKCSFLLLYLFGIVPVFVMVEVGKMIYKFGMCTRLG